MCAPIHSASDVRHTEYAMKTSRPFVHMPRLPRFQREAMACARIAARDGLEGDIFD